MGVSGEQNKTHMTIMPPCCQLPFESLPFNAQDPPPVASEGV